MQETGISVERQSVAASRALLLVSGISLVLFIVGFTWYLLRGEASASVAGSALAAGLVLSAIMLALSVRMASLTNRAVASDHGHELQAYGIRHSSDLIIQFTESLRIVAMNPAAERKFSHSGSSLSGMPLSYLINPESPAPREQKAAAPPPPAPQPVVEEPQTSARRLAMRAGTRLSHLVQPLLGYTEIALDSLDAGHPVRTDLQEIGRASSRVVLLAQALEMFGGVRKPQPEASDLNPFLDTLERDLRFVLQPTTQLKFEKAAEPAPVAADPALTRIAVLLLACNAEEAMAPGSTITIAAGPASLRVEDTGEGLPKDVRGALFRPLTSTKDAERGVGLGLHAARAAMRLQEGDLELTQSSEAGSVLTLTFAKTAAAPAEPEPAQTPASAAV